MDPGAEGTIRAAGAGSREARGGTRRPSPGGGNDCEGVDGVPWDGGAKVRLVGVVVLGWLLGCAVDGAPAEQVGGGPEPGEVGLEWVVVDAASLGDEDACSGDAVTCAMMEDPADFDPCSCASEDCLGDWIDAQLGCNVCVVLMCGEVKHACSVCRLRERGW